VRSGASLALLCLLLGSCFHELDCEEADAKAHALLAEFGACTAEQRCEVVPLSAALSGASTVGICIQPFLCAAALREGAGQEAFIGRARELVKKRQCDTCATAKCVSAEMLEAFCDPAAGQCKLRSKQ
jgi:hypothetical protein